MLHASASPAGSSRIAGDGHALGVVQPLADEGLHRLQPELAAEGLDPLLAHPGGRDHGQVVPVPDLGDADALLAHADDVADVCVVLLNAHAREDQRPLGVHIDGLGRVGRADGVAGVGLVRLHTGREDVLAGIEDRYQDRPVGRVGVAEVGIIVQKGVALFEVGVHLLHGLAEEAGTVDVHRAALGRREELMPGGGEGAGEITRGERPRPGGADQGVGHLTGDAVDTVRHDKKLHRVEGGGGHQRAPFSRRAAVAAASMLRVSTFAGSPATTTP